MRAQDRLRTFPGRQTGEYFGAALATLDVNGDGFDEIVVGAPLFSNENSPDAVRIYIKWTALSLA